MKGRRTLGPTPAVAGRRRTSWARWSIAAIGAAMLVLLYTKLGGSTVLRAALGTIVGLGAWGPALFIGLYVVATVLFIPGSVLTLGAGALFGALWGSVYVSIGATLGATAAFLVGRYLARGWVAKRIEGHSSFGALDYAVADEGWKIVGLTRLSPVLPFTLLNYAFGLTRVKLLEYVVASWIGMMPGTVMYVYLGSLARVDAGRERRSPMEWALYAVGLLATVVVTVFVTRLARRSWAKRTSAEAES